MEQVFLNLIINACHAMPQGGTLTIGTEYSSFKPEVGAVVVRVTDTGTGIAPEHLTRIFEPFFTTKGRLGESETPGSGLGLSVSHGLVTAHGGTITVSSELGSGTTFEIRLPLTPAETPAATAADCTTVSLRDVPELKGARVLVAEDETYVLNLLQKLLNPLGCNLTTATTADKAIEALRWQKFDLVLSDLMMPGGGGRAVLEFHRNMGDDAPPVIIMTGRLERVLHDEVIAMGAAQTIEKPFDMDKLLRLLAEVLGRRSR
jgi:CheY-like chemotaxis protein